MHTLAQKATPVRNAFLFVKEDGLDDANGT